MVWSLFTTSVVYGIEEPSSGSAFMHWNRLRMSSINSGIDDLAISLIGFRASANAFFSSPVLESNRNDTWEMISIISYAKKQSVVKFDLIWLFISRIVLVKSAMAFWQVCSKADPQASRGNIAEIFWYSARKICSMPLA